MNFQAEFALLESSLYCTETDLGNEKEPAEKLQKSKCGKLVRGVSYAVREIISGVEFDRSQADQHHWNFKLHAILFSKLLEKRCAKDSSATTKCKTTNHSVQCHQTENLNWFGLTKALPNCINLDVYLELANEFEWGSRCAQVLCSLEHGVSRDLLEDITSQCIAKGFLDLLVDILSDLLTPSSTGTPISRHAHSKLFMPQTGYARTVPSVVLVNWSADSSKLAILSCSEILQIKFWIQDRSRRCRILQSLVACLWYCNSILSDLFLEDKQGTRCRVKDPKQGFFDFIPEKFKPRCVESHCDDHLEDIYELHLLSLMKDGLPKAAKGHGLLEKDLENGDVSVEKTRLLFEEVDKLVLTIHSLSTEWEGVFVGVCNSSAFGAGSEYAVEGHALVQTTSHVLNNLMQTVGKISEMQHIPDNLLDVKSVLDSCTGLAVYLTKMVNRLDENIVSDDKLAVSSELTENDSGQKGHISLLEVINRVDARLEEYEAGLEWLLSSYDQFEDDTWIRCLERNTHLLAVPRFVQRLIEIAFTMDKKNDHLIDRILKVFLVSFSTLPLVLQNELRDYLWSDPSGVSIFTRHCISDIDKNTTSAFNKLVSLADEDQDNDEALSALSCVALQSPTHVLEQAVHRAVSNPAVCRTICQMLQAMPSLATLKLSGTQWPILCHLIHEAMTTVGESSSEEANLLQLLATLLQPYKPFSDPLSPFWSPPVLPPTGVTQICILPNLNSKALHNTTQNRLMLALKFLDSIVNIQVKSEVEARQCVLEVSVFPIMLCLCKLLDGCRVLWNKKNMPSRRVQVKETVLNLLGILGRISAEMHLTDGVETEQGIAWFMDCISTLHWSTALTLTELLPDSLLHKQKVFPASIFDICNVPENEWSIIPYPKCYDKPSLCEQVRDFLLCCRVSDGLASILAESIHVNKETSNCRFLEAMTVALAQVLPQCVLTEWQCIMGMLRQVLADGILVVPCSACYVVELPMMDISDFRVHLSLSQLLVSVMLLVTSSTCQDWASVQLLHHVTCCYSNTMQKLTVEFINADTNAPGSLFIIGQFFCHACEVIKCLPTPDLKEQLTILALEYLSQMEEIRQRSISGKDLCYDWTNQRTLMELLANQKLAEEQKSTVMQKITCLK